MHLRNYPHYYIKDGERRAVYYSAEARDLRASGWTKEEKVEASVESINQEPEDVEAVIEVTEEPESPNFDFMTKAELLEYASERGVDLPNNALKAELVEACKVLR